MPATPRVPRESWVEAGLQALAEGGVDAVRIEVLAARLGVTKGGFYGHFRNRGALLTAMLDEWQRRATDEVLDRVETSGGSAPQRMRLAGIMTFGPEILAIDLAVRHWAGQDGEVAERLRRVDNERIGFLRTLFGTYLSDPVEIEARSTLAFATAIGHHLMAADHDPWTHEQALLLASDLVLGAPKVDQG